MTFWHWSRVTPYTSSCELAESCVFVKQSLLPFLCGLQRLRAVRADRRGLPLSRSYGVNLPSSFSWVVSSTLGFSPHPPVSVYGTGSLSAPLGGFPGTGWDLSGSGRSPPPVRSLGHMEGGFAAPPPCAPSAASICRSILPDASPRRSYRLEGGRGLLTPSPSATPLGLVLGPG